MNIESCVGEIITTKLRLVPKKKLNDEGRNSQVIIAHDPQLDTDFVIKIISYNKHDKDYDIDVEKLYRESKMMYNTEHPNIAKIQYATEMEDEDEKMIFLSMPYYSKGSLASLMRKRFLTVREIISISLDILTGLNHIHIHHIAHLDIKPTNILFANNGNALITDFGQSRYIDNDGSVILGPVYCSLRPPESLESNLVNRSFDIYAVGVLLYRMCNGDEYFYKSWEKCGEDIWRRIRDGKFPNRNYFLPHIPIQLRKIIKKALEVKPENRYTNCIDFMNALAKISDGPILDVNFSRENHLYLWEYYINDTYHRIEYNENEQSLIGTKRKTVTQNIKSLCIADIGLNEAFEKVNRKLYK